MTSFKRWFGAGAIVLVALALVACPALTPKASVPLPDISFAHGEGAKKVDLSLYFSDTDSGTKYAATVPSSKASVVTVSVSGSTLTVTPVGPGEATVTVTVTASNGRTATQSFDVEVADPPPPATNNAPEMRTISNLSLDVGETEEIDLADYASDADAGDTLVYGAGSLNPAVATVSPSGAPISGSVITITAVSGGEATIAVGVTDGKSPEVRRTFTVMVTAPAPDNRDPVLLTSNLISHITAADNFRIGDTMTYTLSDHFQDPDADMLTYGADVAMGGSSIVTASDPDAAGMFTLTAVGVGDTSVTVMATDPHGASAQQTFNVHVGSKPPALTNVSNVVALVLQDGMRTETLDLTAYFKDPEGDALTFAIANAGDASIATVTEPDAMNEITITAVAVGNTMIEVTAKDSDNDPVSLTLNVTVSAVPNVRPVVSMEIPDQSLQLVVDEAAMMESATAMIDNLGVYFDDPDDMPEALSYTTDSEMATITGSMLTITASAPGTSMITVTASDGALDVSDTFDVTVTSPEAPESSSELPDQVFSHDDMMARTFTLSGYFSRATMYAVVVTGDEGVVAAVEEGGVLTLTPGDSAGRAVVKVTPSNSGGEGSSQTITVTVGSTPVPTSIKPLQAVTTQSDASPTTIMLSEYFSDATSYVVGSNNEAALEASEADGTLTLTPRMHGMATVTVTPSNSGGTGTAQTFNVTVQAKPDMAANMTFMTVNVVAVTQTQADAAATLDSPEGRQLLAAIKRYDLTKYITDPDGDSTKLTFSTTTNDPKIVAVYDTPAAAGTTDAAIDAEGAMTADKLNAAMESKKAMVTLRGQKVGTATITVVATDEDKLEREWTFKVTVVAGNGAPTQGTDDATIKDLDGDPVEASRMDVDDVVKVIEDQFITKLFGDPDFLSDDMLSFELRVYPNGTAETDIVDANGRMVTGDAAAKPLAKDKAQVRGSLSTLTWSGSTTSKITVTLTALRGGTNSDVVAIIATDRFGLANVQIFGVRVNTTMKAEGAQESATPKGKPRRLSGTGDNRVVATTEGTGTSTTTTDGVLEMAWNASGANVRTVALVADLGGHFHDPDGSSDSITCEYVRMPAVDSTDAASKRIADVAMTGNGTATIGLTITPVAATGTVTVRVTCKETLEGGTDSNGGTVEARTGPSVTDTLTVRVTGKSFSQR